ncbi:surf-like protein [Yamadazyma tenuis]|uniref:SURF1-like protein n=1 Tax=Candida tenuis (strain ATCC 10573 / BCRC 21748 / CBS 615 / JCM 9827 / NBRC 10315 / NRRL Y-1498 / VKM Y-70) TaxID=590646 RepID=G3BCX0_CANTC|nr:SURF1-domain-containing protein [Yamadazyma tenuis ATCC 10573]XP_006690550.1 uncharacterized protein CANTEDRAFT_132061 [Yamadazyma tenuis ATCC 10573]EGV61335.1 SURF1-domain-containing protein [Yamadazyma tenuis ATCC 10573]EGV61336.1 hypothetical protein CANTEDRAFT_132061 [Yamadazyma tenuis ATCC 10573]WEJ94530.1 surf-like protein [Yamadazyma tenuis]
MNKLRFTRPTVFVRTVKTPTIDWKPIVTSKTNVTEAEIQSKHPVFRRVLLGLMIAMPVISFGLGCWQVKRLDWKTNLISQCEKQLAKPPMASLPPDLDPDAVKDFEYRRFYVKGKFDYSQEMFLGPRIRNGMAGYLVVTPFQRSDGGKPILVERGWISKEKVIPSTRENNYLSHLALPRGEIEIMAFFRNMPEKSSMQFDHQAGTRQFFMPDVAAMSLQAGTLPVYAQMVYDMADHPEWGSGRLSRWWTWLQPRQQPQDDFEMQFQEFEFVKNGVPIGRVPKVTFTNNHLQYLATWFGVSIASSGLLAYQMYKSKKFAGADKVLEAKKKDMRQNW